MSKRRCQLETSSSDFAKWMFVLRKEEERDERTHYYLARIALEVRNSYAKRRVRKIEDMLIKFEEPKWTPAQQQQSKSTWLSLVGLDTDGNPART